MSQQKFFPFYPDKILRSGIAILGVSVLVIAIEMFFLWNRPPLPLISLEKCEIGCKEKAPLSLSFDMKWTPPHFPLPNVEGEMNFSFDPSRPDTLAERSSLFVRLRKQPCGKRVSLPSRIDLSHEGNLSFSKTPSPFWIELKSIGDNQVEGQVFVSTFSEPKIEAGSFIAAIAESPIRSASEFPEGSPFRALAEARFWGCDLFREKYGDRALIQRFEIGPAPGGDLLELKIGEWIAWQEGHWRKIGSLNEGEGKPIARIASQGSLAILLEGWDLEGYICLSLSPVQSPPSKIKGEELFSALRIRSEKQISCMLEKQCVILRSGDWVFKNENRWRILRKKEERDAYLSGALIGELFVFDRIDAKAGQKVVQGHLFNPGRSQITPIEIAVHSQRKNVAHKEPILFRRGKGK